MVELKPCPFCGGKAKVKKYEDGGYKVVCLDILCPTESFKYGTEHEAVEWWNRRVDK